ncbi:MAG: DUF1553 domain-containing protein [Planctomycetota bacterium]
MEKEAVSTTTGGWMPDHQRWLTQCELELKAGKNTVRFESQPLMSHIDKLRLVRLDSSSAMAVLEELHRVELRIAELQTSKPRAEKAMVVNEGTIKDVAIHLRGSHMNLGDKVARKHLTLFSGTEGDLFLIGERESGRRQLARWMTDANRGAGWQVARVIVNRVWGWHFGQALVDSPNNYGRQGDLPTHPELLDFLADEFIREGWSLKSLHRRILSSATWRQATVAEFNPLFRGYARRRHEAEVIRDTLLLHAGRLDFSPAGLIEGITSQNPSTEDLERNEELHRSSRKRSVYLPVVRSNAYRFMTLFDFPEATTSVGKRNRTTIPTQALLIMNDDFLMDQAERSVDCFGLRADLSDEKNVRLIYQGLFGREPAESEEQLGVEFVREYCESLQVSDQNSSDSRAELVPKQKESITRAWGAYCHTLMTTGEYFYVE